MSNNLNGSNSNDGCLKTLITATLADLLIAWIFGLLWNWLIPTFWHEAPILGYWQCVGLVVLLNITKNLLFK